MRTKIVWAIVFGALTLAALASGQAAKAPATVRVTLSLNDKQPMWNRWSVEFDQDKVDKILKERGVKLPPGLSSGTKVGVTRDEDAVILVFDKINAGKTIRVWADTDQNNDLTDETPIQFAADHKDGDLEPMVKIVRFLGPDKTQPVAFPYYFAYERAKDKDGVVQDNFSYSACYCMDGSLVCSGKPVKVRLWDVRADGKFDRRDLSAGTGLGIDFDGNGKFEGENEHFWGHELIPLNGTYYRVESLTLNGKEIVFSRTDLRPARLDTPAPSFEFLDTQGKTFRLNDYRGRVVLLDFWVSWCLPCVEKLPQVKALAEKHRGQAFDVVGINTDDPERLSNARKVIHHYGCGWRQVTEGKGSFYPSWQVYGYLPERKMTQPLYVVIDAKGMIRAGSNDLAVVEKTIDALLK